MTDPNTMKMTLEHDGKTYTLDMKIDGRWNGCGSCDLCGTRSELTAEVTAKDRSIGRVGERVRLCANCILINVAHYDGRDVQEWELRREVDQRRRTR